MGSCKYFATVPHEFHGKSPAKTHMIFLASYNRLLFHAFLFSSPVQKVWPHNSERGTRCSAEEYSIKQTSQHSNPPPPLAAADSIFTTQDRTNNFSCKLSAIAVPMSQSFDWCEAEKCVGYVFKSLIGRRCTHRRPVVSTDSRSTVHCLGHIYPPPSVSWSTAAAPMYYFV